MSNSETLPVHTLLIGGSRDGQRINCDPEYQWFLFPVERELLAVSIDYDEEREQLKCERYNRRQLRGRSKVFDFLVIDAMDTDEALEMLFNNYTPKGKCNEQHN